MSSPLVFLVVLLSCGRHLATVRGGVIPTTMSSSAVSGPDVGPTTDGNVVTSGTDAQVTTDAKQADTDPTTTDVTSATDAQVSTDATQADADPTTTDVTSGTDAQVTTDVTQADADPTTTDVTSATDAQVSTLPTQTASDVLEQTTTTEEDPSTCNHDDGATPSDDEAARAARSSESDDSEASPCLVLTAAQVAELYGNCTARLTGALAYPSYPANGYNRPCPDDDSQACSDLETGPQSDRPVCPWSNQTHEDPNMSPTAITYVQCRTPSPRFRRGPMDPNYYCDHVYYTKRVLVKEGAACDQGFRYKCVELKIANACVAYIS